MRHVAAILTIAVALLGSARTVQAAITFEYGGACLADCSNIGLNGSDLVSGSISFNDAAIVPNSTLDTTDVLSFAFDFGDVEITSATAVGFFFGGTLNNTANGFIGFQFNTSEALFPAEDETIVILHTGFFSTILGSCSTTTCTSVSAFPTASGPGLLVLQEVQEPVPEPGALALFGTALAGLALVRRRRRA